MKMNKNWIFYALLVSMFAISSDVKCYVGLSAAAIDEALSPFKDRVEGLSPDNREILRKIIYEIWVGEQPGVSADEGFYALARLTAAIKDHAKNDQDLRREFMQRAAGFAYRAANNPR